MSHPPQFCHNCGCCLTVINRTQMNIVNGILDGQKYVEIGKSLHLSSNYVKQEASKLCRMLGVVSRLQLANYWNCELFQIGLKELGIYEARTH